ncbi:MAG: hypothetical protein NC127_07850, partial [Muribaculum sp.]|nr:hypothetical protein [Muribaculum sp.]
PGWMVSKLSSHDLTQPYPVGKVGAISRSLLFSLKKFTIQISLDNFYICFSKIIIKAILTIDVAVVSNC